MKFYQQMLYNALYKIYLGSAQLGIGHGFDFSKIMDPDTFL